MNKSLVVVLLLALALEIGCQNGHKNQSWQPTSPKQGKAKRR